MRRRHYYVYMMASTNRTLYTGVTNDVSIRAFQHRSGIGGQFTSRYKTNKLVYVEAFENVNEAIGREKQIKAYARAKKVALIEEHNPLWEDISPLIR